MLKRDKAAALGLAGLVIFSFHAGSAAAVDLQQAVVRQKVNVVTVAPTINASGRPVAEGAVVQDENVVRTGVESRAELQFQDLTLARLGANAIFTFDAEARALTCRQGAALFSKPSSSGRVEVRAGAITAAITGSTGFVSNQPAASASRRGPRTAAGTGDDRSVMMGMLEGKLRGTARWRDNNGSERSFNFRLGPGEMIVAQAGRQPVVVQFDIARFYATSPLINGFSGALPNQQKLERAVADYRTDEQRGFVQPRNILVTSQPVQMAWLGSSSPSGDSFEASVRQLRPERGSTINDGFLDIGGTGVIRGQLIWNTAADLDLYLTLPTNEQVFFGNRSVTFNNGRATAELDKDNLGDTIDRPPDIRVENIVVNGVPLNGTYTFFVNSFASPNSSDPFTLRVSGGGTTQVTSGTLAPGQNSTPVTVTFSGSTSGRGR